jgi:protease-4
MIFFNLYKSGGNMRKLGSLLLAVMLITAGCTFNIDFLGKEKMEEVVLVKNPAKDKILVIDIAGMLTALGHGGIFEREGDILSRVYYRLEKAAADPLVRGVILRLDTPGGDVTSSDILYREVLNFRKKTGRPVVALMMGVAASGGYYVASACDAIIAHPSTITGSIGVISIFPNVSGLFSKVGVEMKIIKSGELKDAGSPFRDMNQEEQKVFQTIIDEMYGNFLDVVLAQRKDFLSMEELRKIADGRVYTANQALRLKLIDEVGYFDDALERTRSLASIKTANVIAYTYYPKKKTNLYAVSPAEPSLFDKKGVEDLLPTLRAGFYYLWLPEMGSE